MTSAVATRAEGESARGVPGSAIRSQPSLRKRSAADASIDDAHAVPCGPSPAPTHASHVSAGGRSIRQKREGGEGAAFHLDDPPSPRAPSQPCAPPDTPALLRASSYFRLRHPDAATPANGQGGGRGGEEWRGGGAPPVRPSPPWVTPPGHAGMDASAGEGGVHTPGPMASPLAHAMVAGFAGLGLGMGARREQPQGWVGGDATTPAPSVRVSSIHARPPVPPPGTRSRAVTMAGAGGGRQGGGGEAALTPTLTPLGSASVRLTTASSAQPGGSSTSAGAHGRAHSGSYWL